MMVSYKLTENNLHIEDSYKIRKRNMRGILEGIAFREYGTISEVWQRSFFSMRMEWICHNFLYSLGIERARTKDVDLDNPCDRPEWQYIVCGCLVWLFVR